MKLFDFKEEKISTKYVILLMVVAYLFSISMRMIWVYQMKDVSSFHWNHQLMINTNDGYYFASWVQAIIDGLHKYNIRVENSIFHYAIVAVTVLAVKLGVPLDTAILYMSAVISSLVVIPIILIARIYGLTILGFFAALLGSIAWSYYNRTMVGYYDTDMFSAMAPMFIAYFLIKLIEENKMNNIIYASVMLAIYPFLYDQGQAIVYGMGLIYMGYMVLFHRKENFTYKSIILISIALMPVVPIVKTILFLVVFGVFLKKEFDTKILVSISLVAVFSFLLLGNIFGLVLSKFFAYADRGEVSKGLHFLSVNQTVREAGKIPFRIMADRISGSVAGVLVAAIGYILMLVRYRSFIVTLPLVGIGIFSLWGGLRFTVYAVPVAALSAIFLFYVIADFIKNKIARYGLITILTAFMIYPNITHIIGYRVPTVFVKQEVEVLDKLKHIAKPEDYTVSWWDYGYPIWYYSDTNTLIDGGKHNDDDFIVSKILSTSSQLQAANLSRIAVETYLKYKDTVAKKIFHDEQKNQINPNKFLKNISQKDYKPPKKTVDIYLYLPNRMLNIFPTIEFFSDINLKTGEKYEEGFFYKTQNFKNTDNFILLGHGLKLDKRRVSVVVGDREYPINKFVKTFYDKYGKLHIQIQNINPNAGLNVIYMSNYRQFLILDNKTYNSLYIQLFVLENYNKNLFKPVILSPFAKVYKLLR